MGKFENREWFEQLCELKASREAASDEDRLPVCSMAEAVDAFIGLLDEPLVETVATPDDAAA